MMMQKFMQCGLEVSRKKKKKKETACYWLLGAAVVNARSSWASRENVERVKAVNGRGARYINKWE
jgi:hypothetical protein